MNLSISYYTLCIRCMCACMCTCSERAWDPCRASVLQKISWRRWAQAVCTQERPYQATACSDTGLLFSHSGDSLHCPSDPIHTKTDRITKTNLHYAILTFKISHTHPFTLQRFIHVQFLHTHTTSNILYNPETQHTMTFMYVIHNDREHCILQSK